MDSPPVTASPVPIPSAYRRLALSCLVGMMVCAGVAGYALVQAMHNAAQLPPPAVLENLQELERKLDPLKDIQQIKDALAGLQAMKTRVDKISATQDDQVARQKNVMQDIDALQAQQRAQDARQLRMLLLLRTLSQQLKVPFDSGLLPEESPP